MRKMNIETLYHHNPNYFKKYSHKAHNLNEFSQILEIEEI